MSSPPEILFPKKKRGGAILGGSSFGKEKEESIKIESGIVVVSTFSGKDTSIITNRSIIRKFPLP